MTVSTVTVTRHENLDWYLIVIVSRKDGIGENRVEFWATSSVVAQIRAQINDAMPMPETPPRQQWQLSKQFDEAAHKAKKDK